MKQEEKINIFLVDDDTMFTETLKHILANEGREIRTFSTGEACLDNIAFYDPSIIVLDYYLNSNNTSAMNGVQVLNKIKRANPGSEVIVLSSQDDVTIAIDTLKYGAYDYVAKGRSAFVKIENDVKRICDFKAQEMDFDEETKRLKRLNVIIALIVIVAFILSRML